MNPLLHNQKVVSFLLVEEDTIENEASVVPRPSMNPLSHNQKVVSFIRKKTIENEESVVLHAASIDDDLYYCRQPQIARWQASRMGLKVHHIPIYL
jgi:hypothetical protein